MTSDMPPLGTPEFKLWWAGFSAGLIERHRPGSIPDVVSVPWDVLEQARVELQCEGSPTADKLVPFLEAHTVKP